MIVEHCRQQIIRRADRVEVAREMQVDILHGHDLRVSAACRASLNAEHGTQRRLAQRHDDLFADTL